MTLGRPNRRGIALLLVLVTLILSTSAVVALARIAIDARLSMTVQHNQLLADQLLDAADTPIADWLRRHAGRLVLPPDAISPRVTILDDTFELDGRPIRITITAFDQCGMPSTNARSPCTSPHIPFVIQDAIEQLGEDYQNTAGLDLLAPLVSVPVYPSPDPDRPAIGERAATHNPPRPGGRPAVSINTAPLSLIESVYAARGLGGIDAIVESRTAGRVASPGATRAPDTPPDQTDTPLPVSMSTTWSFRIDCRVANTTIAWWSVYADTGSNWERIQHIAITE